ncbi:hypothetical protein CDL15_Pgr027167 [Punica granatum]|uniref:Zinc finger PHD-type domain-containing protein n=1 Tax=Punica granatum TaxID=22663 RepID=A0A218XB89_PUNGR|nr:hypothetical protein CDL15_Pgr027167 [Punica granatum]
MEIQHPSHSHPYVLTTDDSLTDRRCKGCGHRGPGPMYACFECKFYFHKSCIELSTQIVETPLHPLHPLKLEAEWGNKCQCCYRFCYFAYKCEECDYKLDPQCISLTPILKLRDPDHLLFLLDKVDFTRELQCDVCLVDFDGPRSHSPAFVCAIPRCDYARHLECSPLPFPESVRHSEYHHYHDLVYTKSAKEGGFSDGYYCDACEMPRDPEYPAYVCKDCEFRAHVLPSLVEKYENDLLARGASLDAFLHYFEAQVLRLRKQKEEKEAEREAKRQQIKALEDELAQYEASEVLK